MATCDLSLLERNIAAIIQKVEESLSPTIDGPSILDEHGLILYSSCETLKQGKYYFLGLNPGGADADTPTIRQSLCDLRSYKGNAYFPGDEKADWSSPRHPTPGQHPYQQAFRTLFDELGEDPRKVCASNLIFKRSAGARGAGYPSLAKRCWPVHEAILEIVQPRVIIAFGKQAFDFVAHKLGGGPVGEVEVWPGFWSWKSSTLKGGRPLIGLRHPSWYPLKKGVAGQIREFLGPIIRCHV